MAKTDIEDTLAVDSKKLFGAITQYEDYPSFVDGVSAVKVERKGPGKAHVTYTVNLMKEVVYTLEHTEDAANHTMSWKLLNSAFMKKNEGSWKLTPQGEGKTHARYDLEIEFSFPVPGFVLKKLISSNLPSMLKNFEKRAKKA